VASSNIIQSVFVKTVFILLILSSISLISCSQKLKKNKKDPDALKPAWLKTEPYQDGYYTGIGHGTKDGRSNYVQEAKKSALEDLVSSIQVTVSSASVLSQIENDKKLQEKYEQTIKTTATDEIEDFEFVEAWEDQLNYWVYYRLSIARYKQLKEDQKRDAALLASDYYRKGKQAQQDGDRLKALTFQLQALKSLEKYLGEPIIAKVDGNDVLLGNEIYSSIQTLLNTMQLSVVPAEVVLNRRLNQNSQTVAAKCVYKDLKSPAADLPLIALCEKGAGEVFPDYKTDEMGQAKVLINKIGSKELEQTVSIKLNIDLLSGAGDSSMFKLVTKTLQVPSAKVVLKVQRPVVYITSNEKSFGQAKVNFQLLNKLKNLLANSGFEFSDTWKTADLWFDINADSERGSITGSIYVTYLTSTIRVTTVKDSKEVYATTLDRVKGYGLDYEKSSIDSYNKAMDIVEKERMNELLSTVLQ